MSQKINRTVRQPKVKTAVTEQQIVTTSAPETQTVQEAQRSRVTQVVYAGSKGDTGAQGPAGPQGPAGAPGSAPQAYIHTQNAPASTWTVNHNLGYYPNVRVEDSAGTDVEGEVDNVDANTMTLTFTSAFGGYAYLS